jgi:hypothetical protein
MYNIKIQEFRGFVFTGKWLISGYLEKNGGKRLYSCCHTSEVVTNRIRLGVIGITLLQSLSLSQCIFIHGQLALSVKN